MKKLINKNMKNMVSAIGAKERIVLSAMQVFHNEEELVDVGGGNLGFYLEPLELVDDTGIPYKHILNAINTLTECGFITKVFLPNDCQYLWVIDQDKINEQKIVEEIPAKISFKIDPSESVDYEDILALFINNIPIIEKNLEDITINLDYESKEIQSNLKLIGKKMNPFADGEISPQEVVKMASYIIIGSVYSILTLSKKWGIYNSEELIIAKSKEIFLTLDTVISNTDRIFVDTSNCIPIPNNKSESIHNFLIDAYDTDIFTLILGVLTQWIEILYGNTKARVEYLLYPSLYNYM